MKQRLISLHLLLVLASALLVRAAQAQDYANDTSAPKPVVWSGTDRDGEVIPGYPYEALNLTELDNALATVRNAIDVSRDYQDAEKALDRLWVRSNIYLGKQTNAQSLATKQSKVQQLRFDLLVATGRLEQAAETARYPYLHSQDPVIQDKYLHVQGVSKPVALAIFAEAEGLAWDERRAWVEELMDSAQEPGQDGLSSDRSKYLIENFGAPSTDMFERIRQALLNGNDMLPKSLGLRAAPSLARMVLMDLEVEQTDYLLDPLLVLADVDAPGAARLCVDFFDNAEQGFRLRVLAAMEYVNPFVVSKDWEYAPPQISGNSYIWPEDPPRCLVGYWIPVVTKLVSDPRTRSRVTQRLNQLASRGAITSSLQEALIEVLNGADSKNAFELFQSARSTPANESNRPILAAALKHADPKIRNAAAEDLLDFNNPTELYPLAQHADPKIRTIVTQSLIGRYSAPRTFGHPHNAVAAQHSRRYLPAHADQTTAKVLATLLSDADPAIRSLAARALSSEEWPFEDGTPYVAAAEEADADIAQALLSAPVSGLDVKAKVASTLAKSDRSEVIAVLDTFLMHNANFEHEVSVWAPILLDRVSDQRFPFFAGEYKKARNHSSNLSEFITNQLNNLINSRLHHNDLAVASAVKIAVLRGDGLLLQQALSPRSNSATSALSLLDEKEYLETLQLAIAESVIDDRIVADPIRSSLRNRIAGMQDQQAFRDLIENPNKSQLDRLHMAALYQDAGFPEVDKSVFGVLTNERLNEHSTSFRLVGSALWKEQAEDHLAIAAQAASIIEEYPLEGLAALQHSAFTEGAPTEYALMILDPAHHDALSSVSATSMVNKAFQALLDSNWSVEAQNALIFGIDSDKNLVWSNAIDAAQSRQDPDLIPNIGSFMRSAQDANKQLRLVELLGSYMSREAGQELVDCIGSSRTENVRAAVSRKLMEIRTYLEQEEYWASDSKPRATQDEAVRQLADMLGSKDASVRVEAIEGLMAFSAREYMPQLITLLNDDNAEVRKTARRALDYFQGKPLSDDEE